MPSALVSAVVLRLQRTQSCEIDGIAMLTTLQGKSDTHQIRSPPHSQRMNKELETRFVAYRLSMAGHTRWHEDFGARGTGLGGTRALD